MVSTTTPGTASLSRLFISEPRDGNAEAMPDFRMTASLSRARPFPDTLGRKTQESFPKEEGCIVINRIFGDSFHLGYSRNSHLMNYGQMTPTEMRDKATACERLAETLSRETDRHFMRQAAGQWREMALQIEAIQADERRIRGLRPSPLRNQSNLG